jgi:hypothetical protein
VVIAWAHDTLMAASIAGATDTKGATMSAYEPNFPDVTRDLTEQRGRPPNAPFNSMGEQAIGWAA